MNDYKEGQLYLDLAGNKIKIIRVYPNSIVYQYGTKNGWYEPKLVQKSEMANLRMEEHMHTGQHQTITDETRSWNFQQNGVNHLDFERVAETMSYANPIAFIKDENGICHHVLVHESLMDKARKAKGKIMKTFPLVPQQLEDGLVYDNPVQAYSAYECHDMTAIVTWAKLVKAAQYKKTHRLGGRVYVELPKV